MFGDSIRLKNSRANRRADGNAHEEIALRFLEGLGYTLVQRNFYFGKVGEIDLVMRDGEAWVFVEVKARRSHTFGLPEEAVNVRKQTAMRRAAEGFVHVRQLGNYEARFDVVAVDYATGTVGAPEIRHYINAF